MLDHTPAHEQQNVLDTIHSLSRSCNLSPLEFISCMLQSSISLAKTTAKQHRNASKEISEPELVKMSEMLAGILDHTDPSATDRGETRVTRELRNLKSLTDGVIYRSEGFPFTKSEEGHLIFSDTGFDAVIKASEGQFELTINDKPAGHFVNTDIAAQSAKLHHDGHLFATTVTDMITIPFETECRWPVIAQAQTPAGTYIISDDGEKYKVEMPDQTAFHADNMPGAVEAIKRNYVKQSFATV